MEKIPKQQYCTIVIAKKKTTHCVPTTQLYKLISHSWVLFISNTTKKIYKIRNINHPKEHLSILFIRTQKKKTFRNTNLCVINNGGLKIFLCHLI